MAKKNDRINTDALFQNMVPQHHTEDAQNINCAEEIKKGSSVSAPVKRGRKPKKEKNVQVSIYLRPDQVKELRVQDALKEKENDKSAIARMGIDIVLQMNSALYCQMKNRSISDGITPGELVAKALEAYLK